MALEQSMDKDTKKKGGIIGYTQDYNAVKKWTLTSHLRAAVYSNFTELVPVSQSNEEKELARSTINESEKDVTCIVKTVNEQFFSPFQFTSSQIQKLQNVVSGAIVADEFCDDILNSHSIGKQSMTYVMIY